MATFAQDYDFYTECGVLRTALFKELQGGSSDEESSFTCRVVDTEIEAPECFQIGTVPTYGVLPDRNPASGLSFVVYSLRSTIRKLGPA